MTARSEYIAGLRELADYLEAHPALPTERYPAGIRVYTGVDTGTTGDGTGRAIVDQAAVTFGTAPVTTRGGHYLTSRQFRGHIAYEVLCIPDAAMAEYDARQSYSSNIQVGAS